MKLIFHISQQKQLLQFFSSGDCYNIFYADLTDVFAKYSLLT